MSINMIALDWFNAARDIDYVKLEELIKGNIDVNISTKVIDDDDCWTALLYICRNSEKKNNLKAAKLLLSHPDIKVDLGDIDNVTPLMMACSQGNMELIKLLIQKGANVNAFATDEDGWSPLMYACGKDNSEVARFLLMHGARVDVDDYGFHSSLYNEKNLTVFDYCSNFKRSNCLEVLNHWVNKEDEI